MATLSLYARLHPNVPAAEPYAAEYREVRVDSRQVGLILIDVWDRHWCPSMTKRGDILAKQLAPVVSAMRSLGGTIVHAPSDLEPYPYTDHPCRKEFLEGRRYQRDSYGRTTPNFPSPLNQDECEDAERGPTWTTQNARISMEPPDVVVKEGGKEEAHETTMLLDYLQSKGVNHLVYAGAATNECVLWTRNTSICTMQERARIRGQDLAIYLARDLTDTMYVPPPGSPAWWEVHDSGTAATVAWIERELRVPSITSADLTSHAA